MNHFTRRRFLKTVGVTGAATFTGVGFAAGNSDDSNDDSNGAHIVVVGGGSGGATAAKYMKQFSPGLRVTLIEFNAT